MRVTSFPTLWHRDLSTGVADNLADEVGSVAMSIRVKVRAAI